MEALTEAFHYAEEKFNARRDERVGLQRCQNPTQQRRTETLLTRYEFIYRIKILEFSNT